MGCACRKTSNEPAVTSAQLEREAQIRAAQDPDGMKAAQVSINNATANASS